MYTKREKWLIYTSMVLVSVITITNLMESVFKFNSIEFKCILNNVTYNSTCPENKIEQCERIDFDQTVWSSNLVSDLDLVCDRSWLISLPNYGWFFGMFLTTFTLQFPDYFGRAKLVVFSQGTLTLILFLGSTTKSIYVALLLRSIQGFFMLTCYNAMYTYYIEAVPTEKRSQLGVIPDLGSALSPCLYATVGFIFRDWQYQSYALGNGLPFLI